MHGCGYKIFTAFAASHFVDKGLSLVFCVRIYLIVLVFAAAQEVLSAIVGFAPFFVGFLHLLGVEFNMSEQDQCDLVGVVFQQPVLKALRKSYHGL